MWLGQVHSTPAACCRLSDSQDKRIRFSVCLIRDLGANQSHVKKVGLSDQSPLRSSHSLVSFGCYWHLTHNDGCCLSLGSLIATFKCNVIEIGTSTTSLKRPSLTFGSVRWTCLYLVLGGLQTGSVCSAGLEGLNMLTSSQCTAPL